MPTTTERRRSWLLNDHAYVAAITLLFLALIFMLSFIFQAAAAERGARQKPRLILFSADWCRPCIVFKNETANHTNWFGIYAPAHFAKQGNGNYYAVVTWVGDQRGSGYYSFNGSREEGERIAAEFDRQTGRRLQRPMTLPIFWVEGTPHYKIGYLSGD